MITISCPTLAELEQQLESPLRELRRELALPDALAHAFLEARAAPVRRLIQLVYTLPAGVSDPGARSGGLIQACLGVACQSVRQLRLPTPSPSAPASARRRVAGALAGMLHPLGVLGRLQVLTADGVRWDHAGYLAPWALHRGCAQLSVQVEPGGRAGEHGHGALALAVLGLLAGGDLMAYLGTTLMRELIQALGDDAPVAHAGLGAQLALAAREAQLREYQRLRAAAPCLQLGDATTAAAATAEASASVPAGDLGTTQAHQLMGRIRALERSGSLVINRFEGQLLVSHSHTLVIISSDARSSVLPLILAPAGVDAHDQFQQAVARALVELGAGELADGSPFCVRTHGPGPGTGAGAGAGSSGSDGLLQHLLLWDPRSQRQRRARALILRNRALWGARDVSTWQGFAGSVGCFRDHRRRTSIASEDLGFVPLPPEAAAGWQCELRAEALPGASPDDAHGILALDEVAARLVGVCAQLMPASWSIERRERHRRLAALFPSRMPAGLVLEALEAVLDQLHALSAGHQEQER